MVGIGVSCSGDQLVMLGSEGRGDSDLPDPCSLQCGFQVLLPPHLSAPPHSPDPAPPTVSLHPEARQDHTVWVVSAGPGGRRACTSAMSGGPGVRPAAVPGGLPGLTGSCWVSKDQPVSAKMLITRNPEDKGLQTKAEETCADFLAS